MKCLSVRQPWAWALIHGPKRIENRTWPTRYRGPLLIHAGVSRADLGAVRALAREPRPDELVFGAVVGVVMLDDCLPAKVAPVTPFTEGPWCWVVSDPIPLAPVPWKGSLGLFEVPDRLAWQWVERAAGSGASRQLLAGRQA